MAYTDGRTYCPPQLFMEAFTDKSALDLLTQLHILKLSCDLRHII